MARAAWRSTCRRGRRGKLESRGHHHFAKFGKLLEVQSVILYHLHAMSIVVSRFGPYMLISSYNLYHLTSWLHLATFSWSDAAISTVRQRLVTNTFFPLHSTPSVQKCCSYSAHLCTIYNSLRFIELVPLSSLSLKA